MEFKPVLEGHVPVPSNIINTHLFMILKMFYFWNHEPLRSCTSSDPCQFTVQSIHMVAEEGERGPKNPY